MLKIDRELLVNTVILSHSLQDNIEIMLEQGWFVQDLKMFSKNFNKKLNAFTEQVYKNVNNERMRELSEEIDVDVELFKRVHKMSTEEKQKLLNIINQTN